MSNNMKTMDGNEAAAYVSYAFTDVAAIYPITPSSPMAEKVDLWSAQGKKNLFGQQVRVTEMQSEAGAAGAVHGSLQGGALTTTYTASQGLLLMIPNMYKISGEFLPGVFHVSARVVATHALSIFGEHSDVMATRQTGFAILSSSSVQEVMDLGGIAHLAAIKSRIPFLHFFDGFRTSHEINKVDVIEYEHFAKIIDYEAVQSFRDNSLNPDRPVLRGTAQNPDLYFQQRESGNRFYEVLPDIVEEYMQEINKITDRDYHPFNYYGAEDAEYVVIAMASGCNVIEEVVDYLMKQGEKVGMIKVHLYRPFSSKYFFKVLPETVRKIAVLDRTKEPGAPGEPLYEDLKALFYGSAEQPVIIGGRYGLGQKDVRPSQIISVFDNLKSNDSKDHFTIGIVDDLTDSSLPETDVVDTSPKNTVSCRLWGLGSDGTVGANKMAIKIIGDRTDLYAQGYFAYDSKKSGGTTISHLRFGDSPIKSSYLVYNADYVACHNKSFIYHYDILQGLKDNGTFVLNCPWSQDELDEKLPAVIKRYLVDNNIDFYIIDAVSVAQGVGLSNRINMVMQTVFFKLTDVISIDKAIQYLKEFIDKTYGKKGQKIVDMNYKAVDMALEHLVKVELPAEWKEIKAQKEEYPFKDEPQFMKEIKRPAARREGNELPVSVFKGMEDGTFPLGTTAYEKRGIAVMVPQWQTENCIQCNQCSYVCPHAVIRPFLLDEEEKENAPDTLETKEAVGKGVKGYHYRIQVSTLDCTGCANCADICPAPDKALVMVNAEEEIPRQVENWEYLANNVSYKDKLMKKTTVKGSQFAKPLLEFHGACPGCGEPAYTILATQLFGDRMLIANATGCSSIWSASETSIPYTTTREGKGPAWANSLFEDNAEFGFGMYLAVSQLRERLKNLMTEGISSDLNEECKKVFQEWIDKMNDGEGSKEASSRLLSVISADQYSNHKLIQEILNHRDYLVKKSQWIIGGDGWAYDIGYGGLDHVLASGEDVNVLVYDTEVYSNTGGQSSKATPTAAAAKFAASGKRTKKKDLGMMAISYGYVYVAQIAMGANMNQTIRAITEAESYDGPSLIIAYSPCVSHGIKTGMGKSVAQEKRAVETGYWHLYRYNPLLKEEGKNPFILDSKEPAGSLHDFMMSEIRFTQIQNTFPEIAEELFAKAERDATERYNNYKRLAEMQYN
ncbi:pyruvate:ferredoxin (flavodoxin) oxidoreductase [Iocasia frigidifontis]|uniref:Pyruvate:ferredoxin oxidoreductase n=1 Tax=Iocasia fonsfrigidae TaxID=2682810 RepID=A0A8A7KLL6_9FIRM|nr:pyruvate:ferredoxin (flavodoxin) oxidoreductase [Iocasia fonsfrigidae]QTL98732.1 pyruvate:ferredoxin (flavodoxin) oxidoreductase [Iocasia fonsfrigidae]